ncbi:MAG: epoxyqueuosine reductase [Promethearchaeota archaeon]|nr:MAG: epoxyqueuosine reductase [Candidatus Lokiarchaeota archaeon]
MTITESSSLEQQVKKIALDQGAVLVGICSADSIKNKLFSDPNYLLPGAQSIVSIALKQDEKSIENYLAKKDRDSFCLKSDEINKKLYAIGEKIKSYLEEQGFKAFNCKINFDYRNAKISESTYKALETFVDLINKQKDEDYQLSKNEQKTFDNLKKMLDVGLRRTKQDLVPEFSHRCAAEAAGLGRIGWSGNIVTEKYGARINFTSVITDAKLKPDDPLKYNPCMMCKLCERVCQGGFFSKEQQEKITVAGIEEVIGKRSSLSYCSAVCGGFIGQNRFKEWSTWSPYRFESYGIEDVKELPLDDTIDDFHQEILYRAIMEGGRKAENVLKLTRTILYGLHNKPKEDYIPTCGNCQIICGPTMQDKKKSYELLKNSGCIEGGDL